MPKLRSASKKYCPQVVLGTLLHELLRWSTQIKRLRLSRENRHPRLTSSCMNTDAIQSNVSNMPDNVLHEHSVKIWLKVLKKYTWQLTAESVVPGWVPCACRSQYVIKSILLLQNAYKIFRKSQWKYFRLAFFKATNSKPVAWRPFIHCVFQ